MATGLEGSLVKPIVDALMGLFRKAKSRRLKASAEAAIAGAIRELLLAPSDLRSAQTKIAVAKAAGLISPDLMLAEEMVSKHKAAAKKPKAKKPAAKKKAAKKPVAKKKAAAKKPAAK